MATEMSLRVGQRIKQRREELGIRTQRELADLIPVPSVTNQTVNKWEKGVNEPSARYKALLADALEVDVAYFIAAPEKGPTPDLSTAAGEESQLDRIERELGEIRELIAGLVGGEALEAVKTSIEQTRGDLAKLLARASEQATQGR